MAVVWAAGVWCVCAVERLPGDLLPFQKPSFNFKDSQEHGKAMCQQGLTPMCQQLVGSAWLLYTGKISTAVASSATHGAWFFILRLSAKLYREVKADWEREKDSEGSEKGPGRGPAAEESGCAFWRRDAMVSGAKFGGAVAAGR